jgi:hypothetical protein
MLSKECFIPQHKAAPSAGTSMPQRARLRRPALAGATCAATVLIVAVSTSPAAAQSLHVNNHWDDCAFVIAPSLTQAAFREFVSEVGVVMYFRPLSDAKPLGRRRVEFAVLNWSTRIDDSKAAWNDTFSHPDSTHWLIEGDALPIPGLMVRAGVTDRMDAGLYVTKNFNANYGIVGGQLQYNLLDDAARKLAASGRVTVARLVGPEDLTAMTYGADLLVSRDVGVFSPYALVSGYLSQGSEQTSKVDLKSENVFGVQGSAGVAVRIGGVRLGAEYNVARVTGYSFKIGYGI